jgi:hypothetical protein
MNEFEFHKTKDSLTMSSIHISAQVRFNFANECEKLGLRPTIARLLDWCDHWTEQYMTYTMEDEKADKPFKEWRPKR